MDNKVVTQIDRMIRGRYPIIAVQSHEEGRVMDALKGVAQAQGKQLHAWTISRGMEQILPEIGQAANQALADPVAALQWVREQGDAVKVLYVFKDLHPFVYGERADPVAVRSLRDCADALVGRFQTVVLVSPQVAIPTDLQKDVATVDFPLPTYGELAEVLENMVENLPEHIPNSLDGERKNVIRALQGLTEVEADAVLGYAVASLRHLDVDCIPLILDAKREIIRQSGALEYYPEQASYADIGGLDALKAWCRESEIAFSDEAQAFGVEPDRGVLIVGVPGCGKSLTAKAVAGGTRPLLRLDVGALFGSLVGQSEAQTREALKVAEAVAPCVLWIDEIEKALGSGGGELDGGTSLRVLGTILTWMEETDAPVFVVATANDIGSLRPELVRRFGEVFFVDLPQSAERAEILAIHLRKRSRDPQAFDLEAAAGATEDFTGSELEKVVQSALRRAFAAGREVGTADLLAAASETVPLVTTMQEQVQAMRSWAIRARPASSRQETGRKAQPKGRALEV